MISNAQLETLAPGQRVNLGVGDPQHRGWFRAQVVAHDVSVGRLVLTCFMDRPSDRPLEPGERVLVAAMRGHDESYMAPMHIEHSSGGTEAAVSLRIAGAWQPEAERRQQTRVVTEIRVARARRWAGGAWRDLEATLVDFSSRGVGVRLDQTVHVGDRLSLVIPLSDGQPDLRVNLEIRHVRPDSTATLWRAGGQFRDIAPADHERVIRFIFAELRSRQ
jgi:hypothetical protein